MGDEAGREEERPVHEVRVDSFAIARTTVSNRQYQEFAESTGRAPAPLADTPVFGNPDQPVVSVSWLDATVYCEWLTSITGESYRLPTEAEWEKAARGGAAGIHFPWGSGPPDAKLFPALLERREHPLPVGSTPQNGYGLQEMCLNVHEWCADWYDPRFYERSPEANPVNTTPSGRRSSRGGSWRHAVNYTRVSARSSIPPGYRYADYGFRVVRDLR